MELTKITSISPVSSNVNLAQSIFPHFE
uniref:Uncharacterized protein n=1 Tax=Rhizophora mucronata TaxID=61149 RepID=A0A2P2PRY5_RHIMU